MKKILEYTIQMYSNEILTARQQEILNYLEGLRKAGKISPTYREIADSFGFKSTKSATDHIVALEKKGYIRRNNGRSRGIELISNDIKKVSGDNIVVPIIGDIPAGYPEIQSEKSSGSISVDQRLLGGKNLKNLFALQVRGESMVGRGIYDGDWIIAATDLAPMKGNIVVAMIDGESTLKTLAKKNNKLFLKAENPKFKNLIPVDEIVVQGVVKAVLRQVC
ncbi:MAG: transcriptional repressor LexA [Proteobacteria bacterium]|nr:transcriptional repressor LexA [Pseudomonadota bacterium]